MAAAIWHLHVGWAGKVVVFRALLSSLPRGGGLYASDRPGQGCSVCPCCSPCL